MKKQKKPKSIFRQEVERDINTFKRLPVKKKIQFIFDYFKWYILAAITILIILITFAQMIYNGQKPCRLRTLVVLNNEENCSSWFDDFEKDLKSDGLPGAFDVNQDQPFDPNNSYFNLQQVEVQAMVSSYRVDVAIGGPALYDYLLYLNACYPLEQILPSETYDSLNSSGMIVFGRADFSYNEDGSIDYSKAVDGNYAIDISNTSFGKKYNKQEDEKNEPLYAIILSNTKHKEDSLKLINCLLEGR
ncbi:MAG: hypothetical protein Q4E53_02340 [Eubacteriales bacterium]|nr:hypothetical protein [Eubacteriales bacterium]